MWGSSTCAAQSQPPAPKDGSVGAAPAASQPGAVAKQLPGTYTLSPQRAAQAIAYARAVHQLYFLRFAYSIAALLLLLRFRVSPCFRDWAERAASNRFWQALVFVPAFQATFDVLSLPGNVAGHWMDRHFGQSVQGWGSWLWDQVKGDLISVTGEVLVIWLLYAVMRRSARRWWLYAWLGALPVIIFSVIVNPLLIDPLFFHFTPLAASQPELVKQIERVAVRSGQQIPESRIFLMDASSKLNGLNAEMTGLGASRRVVVWDTIIARMTTAEILLVFGHELGHYVLGHIFQDLIFSAGLLLAALWAGSYVLRWAVRRYGENWGLRGEDDWASLPVLLTLLLLFGFICTPAMNAFGRHLEHQADQYGLEAVHGIVPDAPAVAAQVFQILGEVNLEEETPSWPVKMWFYSHPPLAERIWFAYAYNPWAEGQSPRFVK